MNRFVSVIHTFLKRDKFTRHIEEYFAGHSIAQIEFRAGPLQKIIPDFYVFEIAPGPKSPLWTYVSSGARQIKIEGDSKLEFLIVFEEKNRHLVELLAMVTYYHADPKSHLGQGHTLPLGEPWVESSTCDYFLISHPYIFGADLEIWQERNGHGHLLWLLPITLAERDFKIKHGLEELEKRFESSQVNYCLPNRPSVV